MILVRFRHTLRERLPEWITASAMVSWGLLVLASPAEVWSLDFFHVLANIAGQTTWGLVATLVGFGRIVSLIINGAWRPTAHFRAIGSFAGAMIWASLILSYLTLTWNPPAMAIIGALLVSDLFALWFAAGDAKLADVRVKNGV